MTCADFLDRFSDYYDGLLSSDETAAYDAHRAACSTCDRYNSVLEQSLGLLRELPELDPPEDLKAAIRYRIHVDDQRELIGFGPMGSAAATRTVALVAVIFAVTAWAPTMAQRALPDAVGPMIAATAPDAGEQPVDEIELAPFSAGQLSAPDDDVKQLWSYPNAMLYEYSQLSGRSRWEAEHEDSFIRAVGLE